MCRPIPCLSNHLCQCLGQGLSRSLCFESFLGQFWSRDSSMLWFYELSFFLFIDLVIYLLLIILDDWGKNLATIQRDWWVDPVILITQSGWPMTAFLEHIKLWRNPLWLYKNGRMYCHLCLKVCPKNKKHMLQYWIPSSWYYKPSKLQEWESTLYVCHWFSWDSSVTQHLVTVFLSSKIALSY